MAALTTPVTNATDPSVAELIAPRPCLRSDAMGGRPLHGMPLVAIPNAVGTPAWVYAAETMRARYNALTAAMTDAGLDVQVHYAVKANDSGPVLALFGATGA